MRFECIYSIIYMSNNKHNCTTPDLLHFAVPDERCRYFYKFESSRKFGFNFVVLNNQ